MTKLMDSLSVAHGPVSEIAEQGGWDRFVSRYSAQYSSLCLRALPAERGYRYFCVKHNDYDDLLFAGVFKFEEIAVLGMKFKTVRFGFPLCIARPILVNEPVCRELGAAFTTQALKLALRRLGKSLGIRYLLLPGIVQNDTAPSRILSGLGAAFATAPMWTISALGQSSLNAFFDLFTNKRRKRLRRILREFESENLTFTISDIEAVKLEKLVTPFRLTYEKRNGRCDINIHEYLRAVQQASSGRVKIAQICRGDQLLAFDMICQSSVCLPEPEVTLTGYDYMLGSGLPLYEALYLCEIQWLMETDCPIQKLHVGQGCDLPKKRLGGQPSETLTAVVSPSSLLSLSLSCLLIATRVFRIKRVHNP